MTWLVRGDDGSTLVVGGQPPTPPWMVIEQSGGLIQNIRQQIPDRVTVIQVDYDELKEAEPEDAMEYYVDTLRELREYMPPCAYRTELRHHMARAMGRLNDGYY